MRIAVACERQFFQSGQSPIEGRSYLIRFSANSLACNGSIVCGSFRRLVVLPIGNMTSEAPHEDGERVDALVKQVARNCILSNV